MRRRIKFEGVSIVDPSRRWIKCQTLSSRRTFNIVEQSFHAPRPIYIVVCNMQEKESALVACGPLVGGGGRHAPRNGKFRRLSASLPVSLFLTHEQNRAYSDEV